MDDNPRLKTTVAGAFEVQDSSGKKFGYVHVS